MNEPKRISAFWLSFIAIVAMGMAFQARASGDDLTNISKNENLASIATGGNTSYGIGGSDYDIGRGSCKFHVGGFTVAISQTDEFCEGMELIRVGMVSAGILHICKQSKVGKNYDSLENCKSDMGKMTVLHVEPEPPPPSVDNEDDEHDALIARLSALEADRQEDAKRAEKAAQRANAAAQRAKQAEIERKEYAQKVYQELQEWK